MHASTRKPPAAQLKDPETCFAYKHLDWLLEDDSVSGLGSGSGLDWLLEDDSVSGLG